MPLNLFLWNIWWYGFRGCENSGMPNGKGAMIQLAVKLTLLYNKIVMVWLSVYSNPVCFRRKKLITVDI